MSTNTPTSNPGVYAAFLALLAYSCAPASAQTGSNQVIDLYCEGTDYASSHAKHIVVSIDRAKQQIAITDPLRETPRVLRLVETQSVYRAHGDHLTGFIDVEQEKTSPDKAGVGDCRDRNCKQYLLYTVSFSLNRHNGSFEYLVSGEIRERESNTLLQKVDNWGIFRNTRCNWIKQRY